MLFHRLSDYDDAYANGPHIVGGDTWAARYASHAAAFRAALPAARQRLGLRYADASPRQIFDLFLPEGEPRGLVVFLHGGYWLRNDGSMWSQLSAGPLARGCAMAIPTYRLAPEARITEIGVEIAAAVTAAAALVAGPITLAGHSAGGQLVTRLMASGSPLAPQTQERVSRVVSIAGVHDLRPLLRTAMKAPLRLDEDEARRESPVLLEPVAGVNLVAWVGGAERAEFRRQNALLANIWTGLGAATCAYEAPDKHHFSVVEELAEPGSGLTEAVFTQ
jgi:acetyl esterase/lipase